MNSAVSIRLSRDALLETESTTCNLQTRLFCHRSVRPINVQAPSPFVIGPGAADSQAGLPGRVPRLSGSLGLDPGIHGWAGHEGSREEGGGDRCRGGGRKLGAPCGSRGWAAPLCPAASGPATSGWGAAPGTAGPARLFPSAAVPRAGRQQAAPVVHDVGLAFNPAVHHVGLLGGVRPAACRATAGHPSTAARAPGGP